MKIIPKQIIVFLTFSILEKKRLKEETEGRRESDGEKSDNEQLVVDVSNEVSCLSIILKYNLK